MAEDTIKLGQRSHKARKRKKQNHIKGIKINIVYFSAGFLDIKSQVIAATVTVTRPPRMT